MASKHTFLGTEHAFLGTKNEFLGTKNAFWDTKNALVGTKNAFFESNFQNVPDFELKLKLKIKINCSGTYDTHTHHAKELTAMKSTIIYIIVLRTSKIATTTKKCNVECSELES